jgi:hypothetical protein
VNERNNVMNQMVGLSNITIFIVVRIDDPFEIQTNQENQGMINETESLNISENLNTAKPK